MANERPSAEALVDVLGNSTDIFADEVVEEDVVEVEREVIEVVELEVCLSL